MSDIKVKLDRNDYADFRYSAKKILEYLNDEHESVSLLDIQTALFELQRMEKNCIELNN